MPGRCAKGALLSALSSSFSRHRSDAGRVSLPGTMTAIREADQIGMLHPIMVMAYEAGIAPILEAADSKMARGGFTAAMPMAGA